MTIENPSDFLSSQVDVCEKIKPKEKKKDKICPTCETDENAAVPDWWGIDRPFLNKRTCEYSVAVLINEFGETHSVSDLADTLEREEYAGESAFEKLKKTYVKPGIKMMLSYYNKMITDEIVCANPPKNPGDECGSLFDPYNFTISNPKGLEAHAKTPEFRFTVQNNDGILQVLVTVPAFVFDPVPDMPDLPDVDTNTERIELSGHELRLKFLETISALGVFSSYQAYFYQTENGNLSYQDGQDPFYLKFIIDRMQMFYERLVKLIEDNGFRLHGTMGLNPKAEKVVIIFDKSDPENPFKIKMIKAKEKGCRYKKLKKGLYGEHGFLNYGPAKDQTTMGYISKLNEVHSQLTARQTPAWLDFVLKYTYPQLSVDFGSANKFKNQRPDSCLSDMNQISDFVLSSALTFSSAFAYRLNKANCLSMYGKEYIFKQNPPDFAEDKVKGNPHPPSLQFDSEAFKNSTFRGQMKYLDEYVRDKYVKERNKDFETKDSVWESLKEFKNQAWLGSDTSDKLLKLVNMFNPCSFQDFMNTILKCLFRGMTVEQMYKAIIKATLSNLAAKGLEVVILALPADKQQEIRDIVEKEFKDMPAPWEPGWKPGNFSEARLNRQREIAQDRVDATSGANRLKTRIKEIFAQLKDIGFKNRIDVVFGTEQITYSYDSETGFVEGMAGNAGRGDDDKISILEIQILQEKKFFDEWISDINEHVPIEESNRIKALKEDKLNKLKARQLEVTQELKIKKDELDQVKEYLEFNEFIPQSFAEAENEKAELLEEQIEVLNMDYTDLVAEILGLDKQDAFSEEYEKSLGDATMLLTSIGDIRGQSYDLKKTDEATKEYRNWDSLTVEEQAQLIAEQAENTRFARLKPDDEVEPGTMGKALGSTQKAITSAYIDAIMRSAEIQQIMRAFDNLPGSKIIASFIAKFKCPNTHFLFPPIGSFLQTLTLDPCKLSWKGPFLPQLNQVPNISWDLLKNLVDVFIKTLKVTLKAAFAALMAKLAQIFDATLCNLLGAQNPFEISSIVDLFGRPECKESDILKAVGAAPEGVTPTDEEYATLGKAIMSAGPVVEARRAMSGGNNQSYFGNVAAAIRAKAPNFSQSLGNPASVKAMFTMAGGLLSDEQRQKLSNDVSEAPMQDFLTNKCLTSFEQEEYDNSLNGALGALPDDVMAEYLSIQNDTLDDNVDQVMKVVLNGPLSVLDNILDKALDPTVDPDCVDFKNSVGAVVKKAKETKSFKAVRSGIFSRVQKAFIDDTIKWNVFDFIEPAGILGQILSTKSGNTLNYYNWHYNLPFLIRPLFGEVKEFPETVGLFVREKLLEEVENNKIERKDDPRTAPISLEYFSGLDSEGELFKSIVEITNVKNPEINKFTYKLLLRSPEVPTISMEINDNVEDKVKRLTAELNSLENDAIIYDQKDSMLKCLMEKSWSEFIGVKINNVHAASIIEGLKHRIHDIVIPKLVSDPIDGEVLLSGGYTNNKPSQGFKYGYKPEVISKDDLTYVAPDGSEYNFEESERVLGRSKTKNPRVQFLDPAQHGGTYSAPYYNILAEEKTGWSQFAKIIVSNLKGCEDADSNFMFFQNIMDKIEKEEAKIKPDKRLELAPDCVFEKPFDKIASPTTLATLSGIVTAIIRMHVIDYMLRTFSINSNLNLNFDRNYSRAIAKVIVERMEFSLSNQTSPYTTTYERGVYWLLFLEQVTQTVRRRINSGDIESSDEIEEAMALINTAQKNHQVPTFEDLELLRDLKEFDFTGETTGMLIGSVLTGVLICSFGLGTVGFLIGAGAFGLSFSSLSLSQAKLAAKISTINDVKEQCKVALEILVQEQLNFYSEVLNDSLEPPPPIYDISKYILGGSGVLFREKTKIEAGMSAVENPIGGKTNFEYGGISHCVHDVFTENPLNEVDMEINGPYIRLNGGMFLEKYLRIEDKELEPSLNLDETLFDRSFIINRDEKLKGVVNIKEFKKFLSNNTNRISAEANVSDLFGNAELKLLAEEGYTGSIGIKFGVRLCILAPSGFEPLKENAEVNAENLSIAKREKSYILGPTGLMGSQTKYVFPICSYEKDILDNKIASYIDSTDDFNQDLKCYVDGLCETAEFKLFFDHILNVKAVPTAVSLYSYLNFYDSLGLGTDERNDRSDINQMDVSAVFNDTKRELRRLFISNYKRSDFDPPDEEEQEGNFVSDLTRDMLARSINSIFIGREVPWWMKWRYKRKKTDEDGELCENQFGSMVNINKE